MNRWGILALATCGLTFLGVALASASLGRVIAIVGILLTVAFIRAWAFTRWGNMRDLFTRRRQ